MLVCSCTSRCNGFQRLIIATSRAADHTNMVEVSWSAHRPPGCRDLPNLCKIVLKPQQANRACCRGFTPRTMIVVLDQPSKPGPAVALALTDL